MSVRPFVISIFFSETVDGELLFNSQYKRFHKLIIESISFASYNLINSEVRLVPVMVSIESDSLSFLICAIFIPDLIRLLYIFSIL